MNNDYIDTTEAGGGSYPEPPIPRLKCYQFEFNATVRGYGLVYAETQDEAVDLIMKDKYDEIMDTWGMEIEEITSIEVED